MKFTVHRDEILKPLQAICGVVERRQTMPVLANVLIVANQSSLLMSGTDLEVELKVEAQANCTEGGEITLPARKFLDICRTLPEGAKIEVAIENDRASLRSGKSRFTLATLPATDFPSMESVQAVTEFALPKKVLKRLIDKTQFSMAQSDVRYYLNGLMLELEKNGIRAVATDGHRLALCESPLEIRTEVTRQIIIPRKGVQELSRLLDESEDTARVRVGNNNIRVSLPGMTFTSKLIDGRFPDYQRVIPQVSDKIAIADREQMRQSLTRASILSNEKYRGIRLSLEPGQVQVVANNPELEEAEEVFEVEYQGPAIEIGFNVSYLLDALGVIDDEQVRVGFTDSNSSCLIQPGSGAACRYVVMPMRL